MTTKAHQQLWRPSRSLAKEEARNPGAEGTPSMMTSMPSMSQETD